MQPPPPTQIHVAVEGRQSGPFTLAELNGRLADGSLPPVSTLAWFEGAPSWIPVSEVPGVRLPGPAAAAIQPPPLPPAGARPAPARSDGVATTLIPVRNVPALAAYYCGIFSLIPVLGLVLTLPALILGIVGLSRVRSNPQAKGTVHAWLGIILSVLVLIAHGIAGFMLLS